VNRNSLTKTYATSDPGIPSGTRTERLVWKKWSELTREEKDEKNKRTNERKKKKKRAEEKLTTQTAGAGGPSRSNAKGPSVVVKETPARAQGSKTPLPTPNTRSAEPP